MSLVHIARHDRVAVLTLDDPGRRNAMSFTLADEMVATLDRLEDDPEVGALVITGRPPAFCAGADLSQLSGAMHEGLERIYAGFLRVARSPLPSVAAVNGPAVGAGVNLALVCDLRIAGRSARFDSRFARLGIHPGGGHTWMLRQIRGAELAAAMVLFGEVLDGPAAVEQGLAWRCVDDEVLLDEAVKVAARAAAVPPQLVKEIKATLRDMAGITSHEPAVARELDPQARSIQQTLKLR
jgi:enoyl-CoA hydratase